MIAKAGVWTVRIGSGLKKVFNKNYNADCAPVSIDILQMSLKIRYYQIVSSLSTGLFQALNLRVVQNKWRALPDRYLHILEFDPHGVFNRQSGGR